MPLQNQKGLQKCSLIFAKICKFDLALRHLPTPIAHCPEIYVVNENFGQQHKNYQYPKDWCMDCSYKLYMVKSQVSCRRDFLGALLFWINVFAVLDMASSPNVEVHFCHIFVGVV